VALLVEKVVSGGQTGVDRAALDAAMAAGFTVGGCCPKGRKAEDGLIPELYPLAELDSGNYSSRTERNVIDSDGTLILNKGTLTEGTKATYDYTVQHGKPCLIVQLDIQNVTEPQEVIDWLSARQVKILNVAGPRESKFAEGIYQQAYHYLSELFAAIATAPPEDQQQLDFQH
jgi:hypothetical protein